MNQKQATILAVDDEPEILIFLRDWLEENGFRVLVARDGATALQTIESDLPDLIILDIMMPKMDGFEVCQRLREWSQIPIIMLSARADEHDKVKCLDLGADDYITKPFGTKEFIARIQAVLRRSQAAKSKPALPSFKSGDLAIDFTQRRVTIAGNEVRLTPTEYYLLQEFTLNAGNVLTHTHLLKRVWGPEYNGEKEYLHVFVNRLRAKIKPKDTERGPITTLPRVGYRFKAATCSETE